MGYTIAICDDDSVMADKLSASFIKEFKKAGRTDISIDYYNNGETFISSLKDKIYKVVLLDINMEPMDGFAVAETIGKLGYRTKIIFVTSHEEVVYDSFDYTPFYFLTKSRYEPYVQRVVKKLMLIDGHEKNIVLDIMNNSIQVGTDEITYVDSEDHYLTVHTTDKEYVIRKSMSDFEKEAEGTNLARAHKKYFINYSYISRINQGTSDVIMKDGTVLKLGRSYKDLFQKGFTQYKRSLSC